MPYADPIANKMYQEEYRKTHDFRSYYQKYAARIKAECFALFGSKCAKCDFSDSRALEIDHINGGGNQERIKTGCAGHRMYKSIVLGQRKIDELQLLCANCNRIKRAENNEHKSKLNQHTGDDTSFGRKCFDIRDLGNIVSAPFGTNNYSN